MKIYTPTILFTTFLGLFDTFYLVENHYQGSVTCPTTQEKFLGLPIDCGAVDASKYSEVFGIPLALFGFLYYLAIFLTIFFESAIVKQIGILDIEILKVKTIPKIIAGISSIGFIVTIYLVHLQINVLEVICRYCMFSALFTTIIFASSWIYIFYTNQTVD